MKAVKVLFANGDSIITEINGTAEEIKDYYKIGRVFNLGDGCGGDLLSKVVGLIFIRYICDACHWFVDGLCIALYECKKLEKAIIEHKQLIPPDILKAVNERPV